MGEIFKESLSLKKTIDQGIKIATYFQNANNQFFIGQLCNQQFETHSKIYTISAPGKTRWNSLFYMCTTLLHIQKALEVSIQKLIIFIFQVFINLIFIKKNSFHWSLKIFGER